jgi:hypothetical protein
VPFDVIAAGGSSVVGQALGGIRGLARRALQMTPDPVVEIYLPNLPPYQGLNARLEWLHAAARNVGQRNAKRVGGTDRALGAICKVWIETDKTWRPVQWQGWRDERNLLVDEEYAIPLFARSTGAERPFHFLKSRGGELNVYLEYNVCYLTDVHTTREFSPAVTLAPRTIPYHVRVMVKFGRGTSPTADLALTVPSNPDERMRLEARSL